MEILQLLNDFAQHISPETLATFLGASGALSAIMTPITRKLKNSSDITKLALVFTAGTIVAAFNYVTHSTSQDPTIVYLQGALLAVGAQPFFYLVFKPIAVGFGKSLKEAIDYDEQVKSALAPATPLVQAPATPTPSGPEFNH